MNFWERRKIKKAEKRKKDCSTCGFDRTLFEGPWCYRCSFSWNRPLNEVTEEEKQQKCHKYRENPNCTQCSLYEKNYKETWCDYFDVSCAETVVLTHPAATGSWGCQHWKSKLEPKVEVNSKANREAVNGKVDRVIASIKD